MRKAAPSIDAYIRGFPSSTQKLLQTIRRTIQKAAPDAVEKISYGIPTFYLNGNLVHFAGYEKHIGFYPGGAVVEGFAPDLAGYETSKGTVRFSLDKPLPLGIVTKIVRFRAAKNAAKKTKPTTSANPFSSLAAPAQRALKSAGITSLKKLSQLSEAELSRLHGIGPNAIRRLKSQLIAAGFKFKKARALDSP